jgi:hypothetical protein
MSPMMIKRGNTTAILTKTNSNPVIEKDKPSDSSFSSQLSQMLFPGIPAHYPLRKKMILAKTNSAFVALWDSFQIFLCVVACGIFIADTYATSYKTKHGLFLGDVIITQFFAVDFVMNLFLYISVAFFVDPMTWVDIVTIIPVYITLGTHNRSARLGFLRFVRLLRLARIFRTFKLLRTMSGVKRQIITLTLTLLCMTFLAAGVIQILENDVAQLNYQCQYLSAQTNWQASCTSDAPAAADCDCSTYNCVVAYEVFFPFPAIFFELFVDFCMFRLEILAESPVP